ncbi:MAG: hypothetical protein M1826_001401 [Phylliscum demangeonii]|nr:MAG: hypothetical protein M1826_001401 [Phylliscum demangeonii]
MAITTEEGWHTLDDGTKLYTQRWKPSGDSETRAKVVFVHGFSDHCNAYYDFFPSLAARGIEVLGFDQRGWGKSVARPSQRGLTGPTSVVLADLSSVLTAELSTAAAAAVPVFLMGHSMGGAEVLTYAARGPASIRTQLRGYLAHAPFIGLDAASAPSRLTLVLGRIAVRFLPHYQMKQPLEPGWLSRDPVVGATFRDDVLCHDTGTLEGMAGMLDRGADLLSGAVRLPADDDDGDGGHPLSLRVAHGTADRVTSADATSQWFRAWLPHVADKELKLYEGYYHNLHVEPGQDKITFTNDVVDWILARSSPSPSPRHAHVGRTLPATAASSPVARPLLAGEEASSALPAGPPPSKL